MNVKWKVALLALLILVCFSGGLATGYFPEHRKRVILERTVSEMRRGFDINLQQFDRIRRDIAEYRILVEQLRRNNSQLADEVESLRQRNTNSLRSIEEYFEQYSGAGPESP